jgi:UDP-N-acetylglucosamine 2-epimerase (non-hydrolysing)
MKIMTIVGTRPEIIRLSRVIAALDLCSDHTLVHTNQNYDYELNEIFFKDLGIRKPDYFLNSAGKTAAQTIGKVIINVDEIIEKINPEALLILGDTNSCLSALPAKRRKIPIFHMEAGNRCFDQRVPEETNRKIVDHIADINMTYSRIAREYLVSEGIPQDRIIRTGSPMYEVIMHHMKDINSSKILKDLSLKNNKYFVVSFHREENVDDSNNLITMVDSLNEIASLYKLPIIISTHPRTRKRIEDLSLNFDSLIKLMKPMSFSDYNCLQKNSKAVLSDSGTINEESSIMNFRALNIRYAHERPEGMEEAAVMMVGLHKDRIIQGLKILEKQSTGSKRSIHLVDDYNVPNVSEKVIRIIHSYTDYINSNIWKKKNSFD